MADTRENYSAEEAMADGCVVLDGETLLAGERAWADFENSTAAGREAKVLPDLMRIVIRNFQYLNRKKRTTHINAETCTYVRQNPLTDTNSFK